VILLPLFVFLLASCNEPRSEKGSASAQLESPCRVLVANSLAETLSLLSYGTEKELFRDVLPTGSAPSQIVVSGKNAYIVNSLSHTVQVVDLPGMRSVRTIQLGLGKNPMSLCLFPTAQGERAYVAEFVGGVVDLVDLSGNGGVIDTFRLPGNLPRDQEGSPTKPFPGNLVVYGNTLYVALSNLRGDGGALCAGGPGVLTAVAVDPQSGAFLETAAQIVLPGRDPIDLALLPGGGALLAVSCAGDLDPAGGFAGNGSLVLVDADLKEAVGVLDFQTAGGAAPFDLLASEGNLYVADGMAGRVFVVSIEKLKELAAARSGSPADLGPALKGTVLLPGYGEGLSYASGLAAWGPYVFVSEFNHDCLLVLRDDQVVDSFLVGDGPDAVAVWSGGSEVLFPKKAFVWFGRMVDPQVESRAYGQVGKRAGPASWLDLQAPAGAAIYSCTARKYVPFGAKEAENWPDSFKLRSVELNGTVVLTPLTELAACLAEELGQYSPEGVLRAGGRLERHFAGVRIFVPPDDPLTPQREGDAGAGLLMAGLSVLASRYAPGDPGAFFRALARDGADGRFDGKAQGAPIFIGGNPLPADTLCGLLADTLQELAAWEANAGGLSPPSELMTYLRSTSGILPPLEGEYDWLPPRAEAGPDRKIAEGVFVRFDGTGSTDDNAVVSYIWDFDARDGVGVDALGPVVFHAFDQPGAFTVTLTVRDAAGNEARDTVLVMVTESSGEEVLTVKPRESFLRRGESVQLEAFFEGEKIAPSWETKDGGVVSVSPDGTCKAIGRGQAFVEASYMGARAGCLISVDSHFEVFGPPSGLYGFLPGEPEIVRISDGAHFTLPKPVEAAALWAGNRIYAASGDELFACDLSTGEVKTGFDLPGPLEALCAGGRYVFAVSGEKIYAFSALENSRFVFGTPGEVEIEAQSLAVDPWGRLWAGLKRGGFRVYDPPFVQAGERLLASDSHEVALPDGARAGALWFSRFESLALAGDAHRPVVYTVRLSGIGSTEWGEVAALPPAGPEGFGVTGIYELTDGTIVVESRCAGVVSKVDLSASGEPLSPQSLPWHKARLDLLKQAAGPSKPVYADTLLGYEVKGRPGSYMNPVLVLGPPRGGGLDRGSTHVVSLGDRTGPSGASGPGPGGTLTLGFSGKLVVDGPGPDIVVFENAFQVAGGGRFCEAALVQVSQDGLTWYTFPWAVNESYGVNDPRRYSGLAGVEPVLARFDPEDPLYPPIRANDLAAGGDRFDLASLGLKWIRYVRIVDGGGLLKDSASAPFFSERGADIDACAALNWAYDPFGEAPDGEPPRAQVSLVPQQAHVGQSVVADASRSTDNRGIVFFAWDLSPDDGDFTLTPQEPFRADAVGPQVVFTPQEPGRVSVSVLVIDSAGNTARAEAFLDVVP